MLEEIKRFIIALVSIFGLLGLQHKVAQGCLRVDGIYAGEAHSVVLGQDGTAWSSGYNRNGQLGVGDNDEHNELTQVLGGAMQTTYLESIVSIAPGTIHTAALDDNMRVWSWGANCYLADEVACQGILGNNNTDPCFVPLRVHGGEMGTEFLENIVAIGSGRSGRHTLAVDIYGEVWAWGSNRTRELQEGGNVIYGQLGHNIEEAFHRTPVHVLTGEQSDDPCHPYLEHIVMVAGGENHSMGLEDPCLGGHIYCWGSNIRGQLGNGEINLTSGELTPVAVIAEPNSVNLLEDIQAICAGSRHSMALDEDGHVYIWGNPEWEYERNYVPYLDHGTLGDGSPQNTSSSTPVMVRAGQQNPADPNAELSNIIDISAGAAHSMALDSDGHVWTWGHNRYGQLGIGEDSTYVAIRPVKVLSGDGNTKYLENIVDIAAGYGFCLALDTDGIVWSWGVGGVGQLGLGNTSNYSTPQRMNCAEDGLLWVTKTSDIAEQTPLDPCDPCNNTITYTICYGNSEMTMRAM